MSKSQVLPDEYINGIPMWSRLCPKCNIQILHVSFYNRDKAVNQACRSCSKKGIPKTQSALVNHKEKQHIYLKNKKDGITVTSYCDGKVYLNEEGTWSRNCKCGKKIDYGRKDNAIKGELSKSKCGECTGRGRNVSTLIANTIDGISFDTVKKEWNRQCSQCQDRIYYVSKYWATKAQKENTRCYKCYSSAISSNEESAFLDYFNIELRQKYIGVFLVDGVKNNTIYEFLGDFWHGNPEKYTMDTINVKTKTTFGRLYQDTIERFKKLQNLGYDVKYIWESDWHEFKKTKLLSNSKFRRFNGEDLIH